MHQKHYAWAAGIIDGEGCLYIHKSKPNKKKGEKSYKYTPRISIAMTHFPTIKRLKKIFNCGTFAYYIGKKSGWRNQIRWMVSGKDIYKVIKLVCPYLYLKKKEAEYILEYEKLPLGNQFKETPDWVTKSRHKLYLLVRECKQYNYKIPKKKTIVLKKDIKTICPACKKEMSRYFSNGTIRQGCSRKCGNILRFNKNEHVSSVP